jgi:outer membrane PBP1 activator LpoA protein
LFTFRSAGREIEGQNACDELLIIASGRKVVGVDRQKSRWTINIRQWSLPSAELAEAVDAAGRGIELNSSSVRARLMLVVVVLIAQRQFARAEVMLRQALLRTQKRKDLARLHATLAVVLQRLGQEPAAEEEFTTAKNLGAVAAEKYNAIAKAFCSSPTA